MADAVRVSLDRLVLDALGSEALEKRIEPSDSEGDPARAAFGSMKSVACTSTSQRGEQAHLSSHYWRTTKTVQ